MAAEIQFDAGVTGNPASGATSYYAIIRTAAGLYVYADGSVIEAYSAGHWTNYRLTLTESGTTGVYYGTFPVIAAGAYSIAFRQQGGVTAVPSPATDVRVGVGGGDWNGTEFPSVPTAAANAAALLAYDMGNGRTVAQALYASRNKVAIVGSTGTVYSTDDTTASWTFAVTEDATANPIISMDPA